MRTTAPVLILDGGLGTTLEDKYNVRFSSAETPLWSSHLLLTDQRRLLACHGDFAAAGADIISTATYQASVAGFAATRTPDWTIGVSLPRVSEFLEDAVRVALGAAQENGHHTSVALTLGPYGATVVPSQEYGGVYDHDHSGLSALMAWHFERIMLFAKIPHLLGQVEYVAFETIPRIDEVMAIRQVMGDRDLRASSPKHWPTRHGGLDGDLTLPFWISCVYPGDEDVLELPDGTPVDEVVHAMLSGEVSGVVPWGIGINCTKVGKLPALVRQYESVISRMVRSGELKTWPSLVLYPDGTNGEVYNTTTQKWELPKGKKPPNVSNSMFLCG